MLKAFVVTQYIDLVCVSFEIVLIFFTGGHYGEKFLFVDLVVDLSQLIFATRWRIPSLSALDMIAAKSSSEKSVFTVICCMGRSDGQLGRR